MGRDSSPRLHPLSRVGDRLLLPCFSCRASPRPRVSRRGDRLLLAPRLSCSAPPSMHVTTIASAGSHNMLGMPSSCCSFGVCVTCSTRHRSSSGPRRIERSADVPRCGGGVRSRPCSLPSATVQQHTNVFQRQRALRKYECIAQTAWDCGCDPMRWAT